MRGVLGSSKRLALVHRWCKRTGPLSRSVSRSQPSVGSRMPSGTVQSLREDVERGILISVYHQTAMRTDMRPYTERLVDSLPTSRTLLRGEVWGHGYHRHLMHIPIVVHPPEEPSPRRIMDGLRKAMVLDQVRNLKVLIGNQIARCDERACLLTSKIFTLPIDF